MVVWTSFSDGLDTVYLICLAETLISLEKADIECLWTWHPTTISAKVQPYH